MALKIFYAYSSKERGVADAIAAAKRDVMAKSQEIEVTLWEELSIGGRYVIDTILETIDNSDIVFADLTDLNENVLFELGYAIVKNKHIRITLDNSLVRSRKNYEEFSVLSPIAYTSSLNYYDISAEIFLTMSRYQQEQTLYKDRILNQIVYTAEEHLLYFPSFVPSQSSVELNSIVQHTRVRTHVEDPKEEQARELGGYASLISSALGVVFHLSDPERNQGKLTNARYSLFAGMCRAFEKSLLMIGEVANDITDQHVPLDYRDLYVRPKNSQQTQKAFKDWIGPILQKSKSLADMRSAQMTQLKASGQLRGLRLGDFVAETDLDLTGDAFVATAAYEAAMQGQHRIFIGRKGSGKSANMIRIEADYKNDPDCLICVIKPPDYEVESLAYLLNSFNHGQKNYAMQALWKYLIYTEIAKMLLSELDSTGGYTLSQQQRKLQQFVERHRELVVPDIAVRLERAMADLNKRGLVDMPIDTVEATQEAIAETLHKGIISRLQIILQENLTAKRKVIVLVDNLDKAWDKQNDVRQLSFFLFGLVEVARRLSTDLLGSVSRHLDVGFAMFLRSDIFYKIVPNKHEDDKLGVFKLSWNDRETLVRVIEERAFLSDGTIKNKSDFWSKYFPEDTNGQSALDHILYRCVRRPRDLIFYVQACIRNAIDRGHSYVTSKDIEDADKTYSEYVIRSISWENELKDVEIRDLLIYFLQCTSYMSYRQIADKLREANMPKDKFDEIIRELCLLGFLEIEVGKGQFRSVEDPSEFKKIDLLVKRATNGNRSLTNYRITPPFWAYLEIVCD